MKNLILVSVLFVFSISCNNDQNPFPEKNKNSVEENNSTDTNKSVVVVADSNTTYKNDPGLDPGISPANSYSDLFLDSASVESFIKTKKPEDAITRGIRNFYLGRNYEFAWFTRNGLTEQAKGFWNLYGYAGSSKTNTLKDKKLESRIDSLIEFPAIAVPRSDSIFIATELLLTERFLHYLSNNLREVNPNRQVLALYIPAKKEDPLKIAEAVLNQFITNKNFEKPDHPYSLLKKQLSNYVAIAKQGGWKPIKGSYNKLKKGNSAVIISSIKKRMLLTGDLTGSDTSKLFDESLVLAINSFKNRNGLKADGLITDSLISVLNVPVRQRISQILINMNRMIWMPQEENGSMIEVNIPAFMLNVIEGSKKTFDMAVVVGKEGTNTLIFAGDLDQIVFSPYWNVPPSIVRNEILPAMKKNSDYLKSRNMEIVKKSDTLPTIRQLPGDGNALGKIKFLFPNSFDIYFHDTELKSVFQKQNKAVSHGCIRLADAEKMANYLLKNTRGWSPAKIKAAMNSGKEQYVKLQLPVPVVITYFTVWVDENGLINFRNDVYKHDEEIAKLMFTNS